MIEATDNLYLENEKTILNACWKAWRRDPGIDFNDYKSRANEIFMDATQTFNPERGAKFNSWLTTQLLRLKDFGNRSKMATRTHPKETDFVLSLDAKTENLEGKTATLLDVYGPENLDYANKISEGVPSWNWDWMQRMKALKPYTGGLSEDAKTLVNDILDGSASKKDANGVPKAEHGAVMYDKLTTHQLYIRVYRRRGWNFERVRDARIEVEAMLRKWAPCKLPEVGDMVQAQDELF